MHKNSLFFTSTLFCQADPTTEPSRIRDKPSMGESTIFGQYAGIRTATHFVGMIQVLLNYQ
jgi:hypothetical protein